MAKPNWKNGIKYYVKQGDGSHRLLFLTTKEVERAFRSMNRGERFVTIRDSSGVPHVFQAPHIMSITSSGQM
jgi:hypothetical protein